MSAASKHTGENRHLYRKVMLLLLALIIVLNALAFVDGFSDWYAHVAYPILTDPLSRLCDLTRTPIGELIMFAGIAMVLLLVVVIVLFLVMRKHERLAGIANGYMKGALAVVLVTLLLFTLNYLIPLRATPLVKSYAPDDATYTLEQLEELRTEIVEGLNTAAVAAPRTADGDLAYSDDVDAKVATALQSLGGEFDRLEGFYPTPKAALCSDVLEWMDIGGYTYPYTGEITYNRHVSKLYYPVLTAHESVHHKGFYLESEAEFLSYLACTRSDDPILRYSGYDNIYYYIENAYLNTLEREFETDEARARYEAQAQVSVQVATDRKRVAEQRAQAYEANVDKRAEEAFSGIAEDAAEYGWDTQEILLQGNSYSGVVQLLLAYTFH